MKLSKLPEPNWLEELITAGKVRNFLSNSSQMTDSELAHLQTLKNLWRQTFVNSWSNILFDAIPYSEPSIIGGKEL